MSHKSIGVSVALLLAAGAWRASASTADEAPEGSSLAPPASAPPASTPRASAPREPPAVPLDPERPLAERLLAERLVLGTRVLTLSLRADRRGEPFDGSFIGSIDRLDAVQHRSPDRFFVQVAVLPQVGVGFQRDRLQIKTLTTIPRERLQDDRNTDGDAVLRGTLPYLFVRWPNSSALTPFIEFGQARYRNRFRPNPEWYANGWREFILEPKSSTTYWGGGIEIELHRHCALDLYVRTMNLDVPGEYHFQGDDRDPEPFVFSAKHVSYGVGLRALF